MGPSLFKKKCFFTVVGLIMTGLLWWSQMGMAGEGRDSDDPTIPKKLAERFSYDLRILTYGVTQDPADSKQNPGNNFLQIPHYLGGLEIRPDLRLNLDPVELSAKPRMKLEYRASQEGFRKGDAEWKDDWYVNEWLARWKARENLFLSYGRENLQWGPSFLFSPSNPFFQDNGRRNPYLEVPGMDFGRLVWIPKSSWTLSFIANTDEGQNKPNGPNRYLISPPPPFEKTYSLKVDYTGRENYGSVILSYREHSEYLLGFFGGWTISDAVLLYGEGVMAKGNEGLYPQQERSPFGASMQKLHQNDVDTVLLIGGSYTFERKGTLTMEYAYYSPGYSNAEADRYYSLRRKAGEAFELGGPLSGFGQMVLGQTAVTGLRLLRRNYALLQYTQTNILNVMDLTLRWTQNLDDGSFQITHVVGYSLGNHWELFSVGAVNAGNGDSEFRSILNYQWMVGVKYTL
jgi:hypothetical protein